MKYITILIDNFYHYINVEYDKNKYYYSHGNKIYTTDYKLEIVDKINEKYNLLCKDIDGNYYIHDEEKNKFVIPDDMQGTIDIYINNLLRDLFLNKDPK